MNKTEMNLTDLLRRASEDGVLLMQWHSVGEKFFKVFEFLDLI